MDVNVNVNVNVYVDGGASKRLRLYLKSLAIQPST